MYDDLLIEFNDEDYVYIIEGCLNIYASLNPPSNKRCEICNDCDYIITEGYVKNLKSKKKVKRIKDNLLKLANMLK